MGQYTSTGLFVSGNPPGLDAPFFNNVESWIQQLEGDTGSVSVSGQTSGTATLYQILQGTYKKAIINLNNYRNTSAQDLTLPVAFTQRAWVITGETQGASVEFRLSGTAQNISVQNTVSSTGIGGGQTGVTAIFQWSWGQINAGFSVVRINTTPAACNGLIIVEGF